MPPPYGGGGIKSEVQCCGGRADDAREVMQRYGVTDSTDRCCLLQRLHTRMEEVEVT